MRKYLILFCAILLVFTVGVNSLQSKSITPRDKLLRVLSNQYAVQPDKELGHLLVEIANNKIDDNFLGLEGNIVSPFLQVSTSALLPATTTEVVGTLRPTINNNSDLGASGRAWNEIFASGTAYLGVVSLESFSGTPLFSSGFISQASSSISAGLQVAGALNASSTFQANGLSIFSNGFISNASSSLSAGLQVAGALNASTTLQVAGGFFQTGFADCSAETQNVLYTASTGVFSCGVDATGGGGGAGGGWDATADPYITLTTSTVQIGVGVTPSSTVKFHINSGSAASTTLVVQGTTSQAADLMQIRNVGNSVLWSIDSAGNMSASGTTRIYGLSTLSGLISTASSSIAADLQVAGALNASGTLQANGATVLSSTLGVTSLATLTGGFISSASSSLSAGLQVAGALNASGTLQANGLSIFGSGFISQASSSLSSSLTVSGNLSASSTLTVTNLASNLIPSSNNAYNLGSAANAFGSLFASGTTNLKTLKVGTDDFSSTSSINVFATSTHIGGALSQGVVSSTESGAAVTINWANGSLQHLLLDANTTITFTNQRMGQKLLLMLRQDGTGSRTVTWPNTVRFPSGSAPTLTTTANRADFVGFVTMGTSSALIYGLASSTNYAF